MEQNKVKVEDMGEVSDGYHTFNQLYHQRAVLFATIVNQNKDKAWKSWKHEDDKFCFDKEREWFIVGVDTPEGSYTYHYEKKYWDLFDCEELDRGKHWDGHTEDDVTRLLSLPPVTPTEQQKHGRLIDADKLLQETFIVDEEEWTTPEIRAILENAPPVEPPKKVIAQIKVDTEEIVERIKEEYEIKDRPKEEMTEFEYREKLMECLAYKDWQVVNDAVSMLNNLNHNYKVVLSEIKAERQAIIKMLDSDVSNKKKLDFVKSFTDDWRGGTENDR